MPSIDVSPRNTEEAFDDADFLSDLSDLDSMEGNCEPVSGGPSPHGKWELLSTSDGEKKKERTKTLEKEKSFEQRLTERMNAALDESIGDDKMKSPSRTRSARRQNATLEDFMSPGRKTSRSNQPKRNRNDLVCASPIVSPPHKSHRLFSPKRGNENRSTSRFIKELCEKLNEPKQNLMKKILELKGKVYVLDLVAQVEQVEQSGGQFVADGTRRRTKGGVFLNLLKSQVSKEEWDKIFEDEKEVRKRRKAMKRRLQYKGENNQAEDNLQQEETSKTLPVSYKDCLTNKA